MKNGGHFYDDKELRSTHHNEAGVTNIFFIAENLLMRAHLGRGQVGEDNLVDVGEPVVVQGLQHPPRHLQGHAAVAHLLLPALTQQHGHQASQVNLQGKRYFFAVLRGGGLF